jgi:hypothetical protein
MENNNIEQFKKLAKVFNVKNLIRPKEIEQVLVGILQIMSSFKKDNEKLTAETKQVVEMLFERVVAEHAKLSKQANDTFEQANSSLLSSIENTIGLKEKKIEAKIKQAESLIAEIKAIEVKDGKDADEDKIISEIIAQLKTNELVEETGETIVQKINLLELAEEYQIDAKHIKNLPSPKGGYSPTVLGNAVDLNQSARADGYAIVWDDTNKNFKFAPSGGGGGGVELGGPQTGFTAGMIQYIGQDELQFGDGLFVRDSDNFNTLIAQVDGDDVRQLQIDASKQAIQIIAQDNLTGEKAALSAGNGPVQANISYEDGADKLSNLTMDSTGNSWVWDFDTTDDISDVFQQSENILGAGVKGTFIAHQDTVTGERANIIVGDTSSAGGQPFQVSLGTDDGAGNVNTFLSLDNIDGVSMGTEDLTTAFIGSYADLTLSGNTITWDADTSDTIITKIEQSQDLFGLGTFSGTGLGWEDTSTSIKAFALIGDGTTGGGQPGDTTVATINTGTGDAAGLFTTNDPVDGMVANVAAGNGNIQTQLSLSSIDGIFNYRVQGGVGQEAMLSVTPTETFMSFVNDGLSPTYKASIGNGVFLVQDNTSNILYLDIANRQSIFGNVSNAAGIKMYIDEAVGINVQAPGGVVNVGANTFGSETNFQVNDLTQQIIGQVDGSFTINDLSGNSFLYVNTLAAGPQSVLGDYTGAYDGTLVDVEQGTGGAMGIVKITNRLQLQVQYSAPTTGSTVVADGSPELVLNPAGALVALTVTFPSGPVNGQQFTVSSTQSITTLTLNGGTILGPITTIATNGYAGWVYSSGASAWVRHG